MEEQNKNTEIYNKTLEYFNGDELATQVWTSKYPQEGELTPDDMHHRMAKEFNRIEEKYQDIEYSDFHHPDEPHEELLVNLSNYGKSRKDLDENDIYEFFKDFKYIIPQGSVMASLGTNKLASLSNCFYNGHMGDDIDSIYDTAKSMAQIGKRRGGTATDLSYLRPKGAGINNSAKESSGATTWLKLLDTTGKIIGQSGRKMAMMVTMDINHPDIMDFIKIKRDLSEVTNANISIKLNNEFMKAVENNENYILRFPIDSYLTTDKYDEWYPGWNNGELNYIPKDDCYVKVIKAKEYWNEIIKSAHSMAEPGLVFWDNLLDYEPSSVYTKYKPFGLNPCSEISLSKLDSCRLIVVNLLSFVKNPFTNNAEFDFNEFYKVNYEALRLSDDLVDLELEAVNKILTKINPNWVNEQSENSENWLINQNNEFKLWWEVRDIGQSGRRTGLGFTALGDTLASLNLKYDSDEAFNIVDKIMFKKMESELDCTTDLAILRGTFEGWDKKLEYPENDGVNKLYGNNFYYFLQTKFTEQAQKMQKWGRRNVSWSTVAPTGSVSIMTQTTSGIEPLFQPYYIRRRKIDVTDSKSKVDFIDDLGNKWQEFSVLHPKFKDWLNSRTDLMYNINIENPNITVEELSKDELQYLFELSPWYGSIANDINWVKRVEMQSLIQKYISHSISSTINLPNDVSEKEVSTIYLEAWKKNVKGITVYRDGSRSGVLISNDKKEGKKQPSLLEDGRRAVKRPKNVLGKVVRFNNDKEKWVSLVGIIDAEPYEIFTGKLSALNIPQYVNEGYIVKNKEIFLDVDDNNNEIEKERSRYDFQYKNNKDEIITVLGLSRIFNEQYWNYAKLISGLLRHHMPIEYVIKVISSLNLSEGINSWKNGVIRTLKRFIPDGTETDDKVCPECGEKALVYHEGCLSCQNCGYSKCS